MNQCLYEGKAKEVEQMLRLAAGCSQVHVGNKNGSNAGNGLGATGGVRLVPALATVGRSRARMRIGTEPVISGRPYGLLTLLYATVMTSE